VEGLQLSACLHEDEGATWIPSMGIFDVAAARAGRLIFFSSVSRRKASPKGACSEP